MIIDRTYMADRAIAKARPQKGAQKVEHAARESNANTQWLCDSMIHVLSSLIRPCTAYTQYSSVFLILFTSLCQTHDTLHEMRNRSDHERCHKAHTRTQCQNLPERPPA